jgi:hypothetical protein
MSVEIASLNARRSRRRHSFSGTPTTGNVLRRRTQPRASTLGVSRTNTGRHVLRHRRRSAAGPDVTRGRRAPSTRGGQPIGVAQDVPVSQLGRMTAGGSIAVPTTGHQEGVRLASCPGLLTIRTGATCLLERGKHATAGNRTVRVQREDAAEPSLNQARRSLRIG